MAYAAVLSLAQTIDQILNHDDRYFISPLKKQQITSIHKHLIFLQEFLEDFPEKANRLLEGRIRKIANQAEDTIEYFMWKQSSLGYGSIKSTVGRSKVKSEEHHRKLATHWNNWNKLTEKIDSIAREVMGIRNSYIVKDVGPDDGDTPAASSSSRPPPNHKKDVMVGFDDDLMAIKERLCGESSQLQVIPIVGMGGIGKTTLARNAFDDPLIIERFDDIRAWVTVSQDYSAQEILSGLLVSMKLLSPGKSGPSNDLITEVYKNLKNRRYLIVMDDMWSTKAWDDIQMIFPDDKNGSRIMLTTRLSDVAAYVDPSSRHHEMHLMDAEQSWNLLRQNVFRHHDCPPQLETIGKRIAGDCKGLPLAIVVVAGLLSVVSKTRASWEEIAKNVNAAIATKDGQFAKILSLSYSHLPHHLRPCFLYMGSFPEDHKIRVSKLIKLWIAEGFIKSSVSKGLEERAEEILEELVKRNLVLVSTKKSNGKIKSCSLHDLMRDLCKRKGQQEKFLLHVTDRSVAKKKIKNQRHVSIAQSDLNCLANIYGSTTRSIMCFLHGKSSLCYLRYLRFLRVFDVVCANVDIHSDNGIFPAEVFELYHLRYLALNYLTDIPAAILNLQNLQTLIIHSDHPQEKEVSLVIWRMPQLRHIVCSSSFLPCPERLPLVLENLQTVVGAKDLTCTKRNLKMIPNLKKLGISFDGRKADEEYHLNNLVYLHQLEILKLEMRIKFPYRDDYNLAFPRTLKKLTLYAWLFPWKDMTIVGSLPNLEVLKLKIHACDGDTWETNEGEFPKLKFLLIDRSNLEHWIAESSHFPSLKCLLLHRCDYLREIPDGVGEIPTLELIEVVLGNKSLRDSARRIKEEQESWGNDVLKVSCTPQFDVSMQDVPLLIDALYLLKAIKDAGAGQEYASVDSSFKRSSSF